MEVHNQSTVRTAIVVPCFNEADRLDRQAISRFLTHSRHVHLLFVDDGSRDQTSSLLAEITNEWPQRCLAWRLEENSGKAEAVRRGFLKAIDHQFDYIGFWDADQATPFEAIPDFIDVLNRHHDTDVVWGSRTRFLGRRIRRDRKRYFLGRINSHLSALVTEIPIYDASCGAKLFRNTSRLEAVFSEKFVSRWIFDVEILSRLKRIHRSSVDDCSREASDVIFELPVEQWTEVPGSKIKPSTFVTAFYELMKLAVMHRLLPAPTVDETTIRLADVQGITSIHPEQPVVTLKRTA